MIIWNYDNNAKRIDSILFASFVIILITCSRKFPFSGDTDVTQASETVGWDIWNVDKFKMFWIYNFLDSRSKVTISIFLKSDCELAKLFASSSEKTFWFSQPLIFWGKLLASPLFVRNKVLSRKSGALSTQSICGSVAKQRKAEFSAKYCQVHKPEFCTFLHSLIFQRKQRFKQLSDGA